MLPHCLYHLLSLWFIFTVVTRGKALDSTPENFEVYPTTHTVREGGTVTLPCVTVSQFADNADALLWLKNGLAKYPLSNYPRYQLTGNAADGDYNLTITGADYTEDNGAWNCQLSLPEAVQAVSPAGSLQVQVPPTENPTCTQDPAGTLTENTPVDLTCSSSGGRPAASLSWTSGSADATIPAQPTQTPGDNPSLVASLTVDRNYNNVQFTCTAQHPAVDTDRTCDVTLSVLYPPSKPTCSAPQNVILGLTTPTLTCVGTDANPAPAADSYTWKKDGTDLPSDDRYQYSSTGSLTINSLVKFDTGSYSCVASNSQGPGEECDAVQLTVQFATENADITCTPANQHEESSSLECTCTAEGVPPVNSFSWTKDGSPLPSGANTTDGGAKLKFSNLTKVHTGTYRCSASNGIGAADIDDVNITVRYAPNSTTVLASPSATREEGQDIALTCTADAEPAASYTWAKVGGSLPAGATMDGDSLQISQLKRTDSGDYRCTADNGIGPDGQDTITVDVQYPPEGLSITSNTSEVAEGDDISLSCTVTAANPAVQGFSWSKSEGSLPADAQGATSNQLQISNLTIQDSGTYICTASNNVSLDGTAQHTLFVQYLDELIITSNLSGSGQSSLTTTEGQSLSLECTAQAYPNASIVWTIPDGSPHDGMVLNLGQVNRTQAGTYNCTASNIIKGTPRSKYANLVISVNYPPSVDSFSAESNPADENTPVTLTCTVDSNPEPTDISIVRVGTGSVGDVTLATGQGRTLFHTIQDVSYTDRGTYTCQAGNGIGDAATRDLEFIVNFAPKFTHQDVPYTAADGDTVNLTCSAKAEPAITAMQWIHNGQVLSTGGQFIITQRSAGMSVLTIVDVMEDNYGMYICNAENAKGVTGITLHAQGSPHAPTNLKVIKKNPKGNATAQWTAGFNGGLPTTHTVDYRKDGDKDWTNGDIITQPVSENHINYNVSLHLGSQGNFTIRLTTSNNAASVPALTVGVLIEDETVLEGTLTVNQDFHRDHNHLDSQRSQDFIYILLFWLYEFMMLANFPGYQGSRVVKLSSGSIVTDFEMTVATSEVQPTISALKEQVKTGNLGNLSVHTELILNERKSSGQTEDGGFSVTIIIIISVAGGTGGVSTIAVVIVICRSKKEEESTCCCACCCLCCKKDRQGQKSNGVDNPALNQSSENVHGGEVQMSTINIYNDELTGAIARAPAGPLDPTVQYSTVNKNVPIQTGNPYDDVHFERDENMGAVDWEAAGPVNPTVQYATVNKNIQIATGNPYDDVNFERDEKTGSVAGATAGPLDPTAQYATVNKTKDNGTQNPNTVYAQVNKDKKKKDKEKPTLVVDPSSEYSTIDKSKKKKKDVPPPLEDPSAQYSEVKKGKKKDKKASPVPEVIYTEVKKDKKDKKDKKKPAPAKKPNVKNSQEAKKNPQGLIYAELSDFQLKPPPKKPTKAVPPKPRYQDEPTEYAAINWNASRRRGQEQSQSGSESDVETI